MKLGNKIRTFRFGKETESTIIGISKEEVMIEDDLGIRTTIPKGWLK